MKKHVFRAIAVNICLVTACNPNRVDHHHGSNAVSDTGNHFILVDTANKMLTSYLTSINYASNDTDVQSLIIDVASLRKYIDSMPASSSITNIKVMLAHTLAYANSSRSGTNAGYSNGALTIILAAYDSNGNYILYTGDKVLDYAKPCPPICPPGNASNALIISSPNATAK